MPANVRQTGVPQLAVMRREHDVAETGRRLEQAGECGGDDDRSLANTPQSQAPKTSHRW
jgi:hypothetical protein